MMTEDDKSITISWIAEDTNDQVYYIITITSQDDVVSLHNFTASMITVNGTINSVHVRSSSSITTVRCKLQLFINYC